MSHAGCLASGDRFPFDAGLCHKENTLGSMVDLSQYSSVSRAEVLLMKRGTLFAFVLSMFLCGASTVLAKGKSDRWLAKEKVAKKACATGDVKKGIDILGDLYVESDDITFVFNQGRCYQQNHRWQEALDRFDEFLRKDSTLSPDERTMVNKHIADCKAHIGPIQEPAAAAVPATTPPALPSVVTAPPLPVANSMVPQPVGSAEKYRSSRDPSPGQGFRTAGALVAAVGAAAVATGLLLDIKTHSIVNDVYSNGYDRDALSSRDSYERWGWISYGVGAAAIVVGTTLYVLGWSASRPDSTGMSLSAVPVVAPSGAMLFLQGGIR